MTTAKAPRLSDSRDDGAGEQPTPAHPATDEQAQHRPVNEDDERRELRAAPEEGQQCRRGRAR